jgi:hypothetical protein
MNQGVNFSNTNPAFKLYDKDLAILDHQAELENEDQFGSLKAAKLRVYGRLRKVVITNHEHSRIEGRTNLMMWSLASEPRLLGQYYADDHESVPSLMSLNDGDNNYYDLRIITLLCLGKFIAIDDFGSQLQKQTPDSVEKNQVVTEKEPCKYV